MSRLVGKPTMWFPNRSDTNRAVQAQKMARSLKFRISVVQKRNCTIRVAKTKALVSFAVTAKLICAFVFAKADCWGGSNDDAENNFSHIKGYVMVYLHHRWKVLVVHCITAEDEYVLFYQWLFLMLFGRTKSA